MAYMQPINPPMCDYGNHSPQVKATVEVKTYQNGHYGNYCNQHGKKILEMVKADEAKARSG